MKRLYPYLDSALAWFIRKLQQARIALNRAYYKRQSHQAIAECNALLHNLNRRARQSQRAIDERHELVEMVLQLRQQSEHNKNLH